MAWFIDGTPIGGGVGGTGPQGYQGAQGSTGATGLGFKIAKTYATVAALLADTTPTGILVGEFGIVVTPDPADMDNGRLYVWQGGGSWVYTVDMSVQGILGPQGNTGAVGPQGNTGPSGLNSVFIGATGASAGASGAVPTPEVGDGTKYLKGDATWSNIDTLYLADGSISNHRTVNLGVNSLSFNSGDYGNFSYRFDKNSALYSPLVFFSNTLGRTQVSFGANNVIASDIVAASTIAGLTGNDTAFTARAGYKLGFGVNDNLAIKINTDNSLTLPQLGAGILKTDLSGNVTANTSQLTELGSTTGVSVYSGTNTAFDPTDAVLNDKKGLVLQASDVGGTGAVANIAATGTETGNFPSQMRFWTRSSGATEVTRAGSISSAQKWAFGPHDATAKVDIAGDIKITDGSQGSGKVLTSDANGLASWQTPSAGASVGDWKAVASAFTGTVSAPWLLAGSTFNTTTYPLFKTAYTSFGFTSASSTTTGTAITPNSTYAPSVGQFVIVCNTNQYVRLVHPTTGVTTTSAITVTTQRGICANNTYLWVGEASGTTLYRSTDAANWTTQNCTLWAGTSDKRLYALGGTSGTIVAHNRATASVSVSYDNGDTWASKTMPVTAYYISVANGKFFILPLSANANIYSTTDFVTFTAHNTGVSQLYYSVNWNGSRYVLALNASTATVYQSTDLSSWGTATLPASKTWSISSTPSGFVGVSTDSANTTKSTDGLTWSAGGFSISGGNAYGIPSSDGVSVYLYPISGGAPTTWRITAGYPATGTVPSNPVALSGASWYIYGG